MSLTKPTTDVEPDESGSRFQSGTFSLSVGPDARHFEIHEAVLFQSPVLALFCTAEFKEKHDRHITLPDDDPEIFGHLIHYLYAQDFNTKASTKKASVIGKELGTMYILAEKYQLNRLKQLTVTKLKAVMKPQTNPIQIIEMAQCVYANIPDTDEHFRNYFLSVLPECLTVLSLAQVTTLAKDVVPTNQLWKDIFEASIKLVATKNEEISAFKISLRGNKQMHSELKENFTGLERAKKRIESKHHDKHPDCTWCK
ncbi:MAG: hypothetical protein M1812_001492 [Candelaria pacifica]|nr:MAG: hypothetical protein M1812_001492 [Candelaria pacifica]